VSGGVNASGSDDPAAFDDDGLDMTDFEVIARCDMT
jgi:hypothetical protein